MLIYDFHAIGNKLHALRKRMGMTQAEVAEAAGVADRTYADIERAFAEGKHAALMTVDLPVCGGLTFLSMQF